MSKLSIVTKFKVRVYDQAGRYDQQRNLGVMTKTENWALRFRPEKIALDEIALDEIRQDKMDDPIVTILRVKNIC